MKGGELVDLGEGVGCFVLMFGAGVLCGMVGAVMAMWIVGG